MTGRVTKRCLNGHGDVPELLRGNESAYEMAYLDRGKRGVFEVALFKLFNMGLLKKGNADYQILQIDSSAAKTSLETLEGIETDLLRYFARARLALDVPDVMLRHTRLIDETLVGRELLISTRQYKKVLFTAVTGLFLLIGMGVYKLIAALHTGHSNIIFLLILMIFSSYVYCKDFFSLSDKSMQKRRTEAGEELLVRLRNSCGPAQKADLENMNFDYSLLLPVAVFGVSILPSAAYPLDIAARQAILTSGGEGGGGCSGGCGSSGCGGCGGCG